MAGQVSEGGECRAKGRFRRLTKPLTIAGRRARLAPVGADRYLRPPAAGAAFLVGRGGTMPDVGGVAVERLRSFIERIERLEEEKRALSGDIKEVYAEANGTGFEPKIMRQIVKIRKMDEDEVVEEESLLDLYKRALGMMPEAAIETQAAE